MHLRESTGSGGLLETGRILQEQPSSARLLPTRGVLSSPGNLFQYTASQSPVRVEDQAFPTPETTPTLRVPSYTSQRSPTTATSSASGRIMPQVFRQRIIWNCR